MRPLFLAVVQSGVVATCCSVRANGGHESGPDDAYGVWVNWGGVLRSAEQDGGGAAAVAGGHSHLSEALKWPCPGSIGGVDCGPVFAVTDAPSAPRAVSLLRGTNAAASALRVDFATMGSTH